MDEGAPLGITAPIETCGVFPTISKETATVEAETFYTKTTEGLIYRSAVEEAPWVQSKLDEMVADSSMLVFQDLASAEAALGPLVISKLACLVKENEKGEKKHRLLVDMLRSGSNSLLLVPERGVLPRLKDAGSDTKRLLSLCVDGEFVEILVLDYSDAFFTIGVKAEEQRFQAVMGPDGRVYIFTVLGMGGGSAPLIWGRVGAWTGRHTQALFDESTVRTQIFVDDPFVAARGRRKPRRRRLCIAILFWMCLCFQ